MKKITIITGATASGKTRFSLEYAKKFEKASIINADASAVYKNFPILSAQPEHTDIPHFLFEITEITSHFTVAKWLEEVYKLLQTDGQKIIVGGTCMYIYLLINGLVQMPTILVEVREEAYIKLKQIGYEEFLKEVVALDEFTPKDSQRLINNYCLIKQTGKTFGQWQASPKQYKLLEEEYDVIKIMPSREDIYKNCNERFEVMIKQGAIEEVENAIKIYGDCNDFKKIIGANEIKMYLQGIYTLEEMQEKAKQKTRNLAKSQLTWLRNKI